MTLFSFRPSVLTASILMLGMTTHSFASESLQAEVQQLRQELQQLRDLVAQQGQQNQAVQQVQQQLVNQVETVQSAQKTAVPTLKTASGSTFKLYGNVRADVSYQAEGGATLAHPYNQISSVALEGTAENSDRFKSTLSATRLGLDFVTPVGEESVSGKVEVDFLGSSGSRLETLRIRHAYLNYGNWLVGQTWSNFAVPDYMPETVDALAYVGGAVKRTPQARYQFDLQPSTKVFVAVEDPDSSSKRMPAVTARLNHAFADNAGVVSVRGMVHEKKTANDEAIAWGTGVGVKYNLTPQTTLKADYYHVKGDSSFVSYANTGAIENTTTGKIAENEFDSITVGLTQQFNPQWRGTLGYGYMKADVDNDDYRNAVLSLTSKENPNPSVGINKELWQGWANLFYSPTKPISLGLEYVYGERTALGKAANGSNTGEDNRINAVAIYNF